MAKIDFNALNLRISPLKRGSPLFLSKAFITGREVFDSPDLNGQTSSVSTPVLEPTDFGVAHNTSRNDFDSPDLGAQTSSNTDTALVSGGTETGIETISFSGGAYINKERSVHDVYELDEQGLVNTELLTQWDDTRYDVGPFVVDANQLAPSFIADGGGLIPAVQCGAGEGLTLDRQSSFMTNTSHFSMVLVYNVKDLTTAGDFFRASTSSDPSFTRFSLGHTGSGGAIRVEIRRLDGDVSSVYTGGTLTTNTWGWIGVRIDYVGQTLRVYHNGTLVINEINVLTSGSVTNANEAIVTLGSGYPSNDTDSHLRLLLTYTSELSEDEWDRLISLVTDRFNL